MAVRAEEPLDDSSPLRIAPGADLVRVIEAASASSRRHIVRGFEAPRAAPVRRRPPDRLLAPRPSGRPAAAFGDTRPTARVGQGQLVRSPPVGDELLGQRRRHLAAVERCRLANRPQQVGVRHARQQVLRAVDRFGRTANCAQVPRNSDRMVTIA